MDSRKLRRVFDGLILVVFLAGSAFYFPKLFLFARRQDPEYFWLFLCVGLIPFFGSIGILIPCLTLFSPPLSRLKRVGLGLLSLLPLLLAGPAIGFGPPELRSTFLRLGIICSIGIWVFALPGALFNQPLNRLIYQLVGILIPPRTVRRPPARPAHPPHDQES